MAEFEIIQHDDDPYVKALLARSLTKSGERGEAVKLLNELKSLFARRYVPTVSFVMVYAALGDKDEAFSWLEKDFNERSYQPAFYAVDVTLDDLRDDPRFAEFVRRTAAAKMD
jgi:predicted Zn-dependent protease